MFCLTAVRQIFLILLLCTFSTYIHAAPGNDDCSATSPSLISNGACNTTSTLYQATNSGVASANGTAYDVWFQFTPASAIQTIAVSYSNPTNLTTSNSYIEVFDGSCNGTSLGY